MTSPFRVAAIACCLTAFAGIACASEAALPPRANAADLFKALKAAKVDAPAPGEKSDALAARRATFQYEKQSLGDEMMVTFSPSAVTNCQRTVDEARGMLAFQCTFKSGQGERAKGLLIPLSQRAVGQGHYLAANAANRRVTIERREIGRTGVLAVTTTVQNFSESTLSVSDIPVPSGKFAQEWAQLQVGIVFKPQPPYADVDFEGKNATLADPYEFSVRTEALVGHVAMVHVLRKGERKPVVSLRPLLQSNGQSGAVGAMMFEPVAPETAKPAVTE